MTWEEAQAEAAALLTAKEGSIAEAFSALGVWPWEDVVIPVAETTMKALINPPASIGIEGTREAFELFSARLAGLCAAFAMTAVLADRERIVGIIEDPPVGPLDLIDAGRLAALVRNASAAAEDQNS